MMTEREIESNSDETLHYNYFWDPKNPPDFISVACHNDPKLGSSPFKYYFVLNPDAPKWFEKQQISWKTWRSWQKILIERYQSDAQTGI